MLIPLSQCYKSLINLSTLITELRVVCVDLFQWKHIHWYQWFFQNKWLSYQAGLVRGVSSKHQATNPITNNDINIVLWGSLYVKISEKSGKPMWLQKAWAANGATKWPANKRVHFLRRSINKVGTYNINLGWLDFEKPGHSGTSCRL